MEGPIERKIVILVVLSQLRMTYKLKRGNTGVEEEKANCLDRMTCPILYSCKGGSLTCIKQWGNTPLLRTFFLWHYMGIMVETACPDHVQRMSHQWHLDRSLGQHLTLYEQGGEERWENIKRFSVVQSLVSLRESQLRERWPTAWLTAPNVQSDHF
jgi:hypothetical protein